MIGSEQVSKKLNNSEFGELLAGRGSFIHRTFFYISACSDLDNAGYFNYSQPLIEINNVLRISHLIRRDP